MLLANRLKFLGFAVFYVGIASLVHHFSMMGYYHYCSRDLIKILLFRKSSVCTGLLHTANVIERVFESLVTQYVGGLKFV